MIGLMYKVKGEVTKTTAFVRQVPLQPTSLMDGPRNSREAHTTSTNLETKASNDADKLKVHVLKHQSNFITANTFDFARRCKRLQYNNNNIQPYISRDVNR